jgi:hydroxymethylbilane synthase
MEKTKRKIEAAFPNIKVELLPRESRGDQLQNIPLQTVEGSDFFTQDIFDALENGEADIAVHSLKDMSGSHFFGENKFAIIERDDTRDVAIFNKSVEEKIKQGQTTIIIGTCSPRREETAIGFLRKALPQWNNDFLIQTKIIRGNVDTRLRKLDAGEYDGIILATAGINRLLDSEKDAASIEQLLVDKKLMLLPLIECVPAPCQGAIVAEAHHSNARAIEVLNAINQETLMQDCINEKQTALNYGTGCLQKFGVTTIHYNNESKVGYAAGISGEGDKFSHWSGLPEVDLSNHALFSTTDYMGIFFAYKHEQKEIVIQQPIVYVANYKAVKHEALINQLHTKNVWAAGTKTWYELAKQKIWVTGCADAFGLEFMEKAWQMHLLKIDRNDVCIITGNQAVTNWQNKGWNAIGTYSFSIKEDETIKARIQEATAFFWTSFHQFHHYKSLLNKESIHLCPSGETANLLKEAGINPIVFPNIKSFLQWKK